MQMLLLYGDRLSRESRASGEISDARIDQRPHTKQELTSKAMVMHDCVIIEY